MSGSLMRVMGAKALKLGIPLSVQLDLTYRCNERWVQFPLPSGNVRRSKFIDIWQNSPELKEVRSITMSDLQGCSKCMHGSSGSRCPGLAYMEGNMRGTRARTDVGMPPRAVIRLSQ